jgi:uncharacterized protein (TIGR01777 family)
MKIILPGGAGHLGTILARHLVARGHDVVVLTRTPTTGSPWRSVHWDGETLGDWQHEIDGADAVINLAGRSVDYRYTAKNKKDMYDSRILSTRVLGQAIAQAKRPPAVWLQMSTATLYSHRFDAANDEATGTIGQNAPGYHPSWKFSIEIARDWEAELIAAGTPTTRKVILRCSMVMTTAPGTVFDILYRLARWGLGGPIAGGQQYMSWIHERDFVRAVELLLTRADLSGVVNLAAPNPLPQRDFMIALREAARAPIGLPAAAWMVSIGAFLLRTETELLFKSRRVVSNVLPAAGFQFEFPTWPLAANDLIQRRQALSAGAAP